MAIRLPDAGEGHLWSESVTPDPLTEVAPETRAGLDAMQALDDDLFVSTSLAELATSHRNEAERRHRGAEVLEPDARFLAADGFAGGLDRAFQRDVEARVAAFRTLQGPKPSNGALGRLREQAGRLRQDLRVKAVTAEDRLRKQAQLGRAERAAASLAPLVREQPDALDEAMRRLDDLGRAIRPLTGDEAADAFLSSGRARLVDSALGGLGDLAPDLSLSALESGAFDAHLDPARKRSYLKAARDGLAARRSDERIVEKRLSAAETRRFQWQALSFAAGFTDRLAAGETMLNEDLARAEANGVVTSAQAAQLRRRMADAETARAERDARTARVAALLEEGGALDPESDADRQDASLWFDAYIKPGLDALPPAGRLGSIRRLEESIGFVPEAAICPLAGAMLTGPAQDRMAAAQTLIDLVGRQRGAASCLPPGAVPMARLFGELDRFGIDAETAASWIDDPDSIRNPVVRDMMFRAGRDNAGFVTAYQFNSEPSRLKLLSADAADTWPDSEGNGGAGGTEMERRLSKSIEAGSDHDRFDPLGENDEPSRGRESDGAATGDEVSIGAAAGTASRGIVSGILPQTEAEMHAARKNFEERLVGSQMPAGERFVTTGALRRGGPKISNALDRNNLKETRRTLEKMVGTGREFGRPVSANLLDHFLKGSGEKVTLDKGWVREYPPVLDGQRKTEGHFEGWLRGHLRDTESGRIVDWLESDSQHLKIDKMSWHGAFSGGGKFGLTDQENAIGGGTVIGIGKLTLEKVGESRVRVSGTVSHRLDDKYDFGKGDIGQNELLPAGIVAGDPFLSRERITRVEAAGGARKFDIESTSWRRELSGELTFKGDKVIGSNFDWNDID